MGGFGRIYRHGYDGPLTRLDRGVNITNLTVISTALTELMHHSHGRIHIEDVETMVNFSDPVGSEERLRVAMSAETDPRRTTVLGTQLARLLGLKGRYAEAHTELDSLRDDDPEEGPLGPGRG